MNDQQRLELIAETVRYAQRMKALGGPASVYAKAVREAVHFLWERRHGRPKRDCAQYRSLQLIDDSRYIYDHAVPLKFLIADLLDLPQVTPESIAAVLQTAGPICLITPEEDATLRSAGFASSMPDRADPFSRYRAVGIRVRRV
jgi:hypothetical protein